MKQRKPRGERGAKYTEEFKLAVKQLRELTENELAEPFQKKVKRQKLEAIGIKVKNKNENYKEMKERRKAEDDEAKKRKERERFTGVSPGAALDYAAVQAKKKRRKQDTRKKKDEFQKPSLHVLSNTKKISKGRMNSKNSKNKKGGKGKGDMNFF